MPRHKSKPSATTTSVADPYLLERLNSMQLRTQLVVQTILSGRHRSSHQLGSAEFSDYSKYSPGDDLRRIDWNVYAKSDRLYTKHFHDERALRTYIFLDTSPSMDFSGEEGVLTKLRYGSFVAAAFASILISQQDLVGLVWEKSQLPPKTGKPQLNQLFHLLESMTSSTMAYEETLRRVLPSLPPRALLFLISDFLDLSDETFSLLEGVMARGCVVVALQVVDPWERDFPFKGMTKFQHPETGEEVTLQAEAVRESYMARMEAYQTYLRDMFLSRGVVYRSRTTRESIEETLVALLRDVERGR